MATKPTSFRKIFVDDQGLNGGGVAAGEGSRTIDDRRSGDDEGVECEEGDYYYVDDEEEEEDGSETIPLTPRYYEPPYAEQLQEAAAGLSVSSASSSSSRADSSSHSSSRLGRSTYLGFFRSASPPPGMPTPSGESQHVNTNSYYQYRSRWRREQHIIADQQGIGVGVAERSAALATNGEKEDGSHAGLTPKRRGDSGKKGEERETAPDGSLSSPSSLSQALQEEPGDEGRHEKPHKPHDREIMSPDRRSSTSPATVSSAYLVAPYWRHAFGTEGPPEDRVEEEYDGAYCEEPLDDKPSAYAHASEEALILGDESGMQDDAELGRSKDTYGEHSEDDEDEANQDPVSSPYALGNNWWWGANHEKRGSAGEQEIVFSRSCSSSTTRNSLSSAALSSPSLSSSVLAGEHLATASVATIPSGAAFSPSMSTSVPPSFASYLEDGDTTAAAAGFFPQGLRQVLRERLSNMAPWLQRSANLQSLLFMPARTRTSQLPRLLQEHRDRLQRLGFYVASDETDPLDRSQSRPAFRQEHWDFCLVLQPQQVYGYWSNLLDFRSEFEVHNGTWCSSYGEDGEFSNEREEEMGATPQSISTAHCYDFSTPNEGMGIEVTAGTPFTGLRRRNATATSFSSRSRSVVTNTAGTSFRMTSPLDTDELRSVSSRLTHPAPRSSARKSVFERAVLSPGAETMAAASRSAPGTVQRPSTLAFSSHAAPTVASATPSFLIQNSALVRRRWGASQMAPSSAKPSDKNRESSSLSSPPVRALEGHGARAALTTRESDGKAEASSIGGAVKANQSRKNTSRPQNANILRIEDIPQQRMARGVAARTHGLIGFVAALKRGIVVRLHTPNHGAALVRFESSDGGDTIRYTAVMLDDPGSTVTAGGIPISDTDESVREVFQCLTEQRLRYHTAKYQTQGVEIAPWSLPTSLQPETSGADDENSAGTANLRHATKTANAFVPDYVAAQKQQQAQRRIRVGAVLAAGAASARRQLFKGTISAADIAVVHPATFSDPRFPGECATSTFRRSLSGFNPSLSFSLVLRNDHHRNISLLPLLRRKSQLQDSSLPSPPSIDEYESKWLQGQGSESMFKYLDIESATLGEYWMLFRGFLLLHRDAAVGRFAEHRAAGIGSHYSRIELELARDRRALHSQRRRRSMSCAEDEIYVDPLIRLHQNEFHEPATVGCWERMLVKIRGDDETYLQGYVLETAKDPPPSDYFLGFSSPGTAIWSRLRQAGLETSRVYSLDPNRALIKVRCPTYRLLDVAEVLKLKIRTQDGTYVAFSLDMIDLYPSGFLRSSLRQSIIDFIIGSRIRDSGAELAQNTSLGKMIQTRMPLHMHDHLETLYNGWFLFWRRQNWARGRDGRSMMVVQLTAGEYRRPREQQPASRGKHKNDGSTSSEASASRGSDTSLDDDSSGNDSFPSIFTRVVLGSFYQPLDSIEEYFGEKVAFYFAWLQHTALHLIFLTVAGLIVFAIQLATGNWDHWIRPFFSLFVMLWTFVVLINWKKRANFLAHRWGTMNYKEQEITRPQFHGDYVQDDVTGEWVITYPSWKRWIKYTISFPLTLLVTCGSLYLIYWVHSNRETQLSNYYMKKYNITGSDSSNVTGSNSSADLVLTQELLLDPTFWFITVGMPSILGLFLPLVNLILMRVSVMLNEFENYRTESEYRTFLIVKVFSFRFVCYFATLYYYSFSSVKKGSDEALKEGMFRVASGVLVYTTVTQWWQNFLAVGFPVALRAIRMRHRKNRLCDELYDLSMEDEEIRHLADIAGGRMDESLKKRHIQALNKRLLLEQAQDPMWLEVMLPLHDSFPEYIQAVVQFTYVCCFSVALPITPMIVLFNYLMGMRLDAYKLCRGRRRPLAEKTGGIGIWEHLLHIVSVIGILTNCWLVGFNTELFRSIGESESVGQVGLFAIVVGWEHIMLLIKYVMQTSISPLPLSVANSLRREQYDLEQQRNSSMRYRRLKHQRDEEEFQQNQLLGVVGKARQDSVIQKTPSVASALQQ